MRDYPSQGSRRKKIVLLWIPNSIGRLFLMRSKSMEYTGRGLTWRDKYGNLCSTKKSVALCNICDRYEQDEEPLEER